MSNCKSQIRTRLNLQCILLLSLVVLAVGNLKLNCPSKCHCDCNDDMETDLAIDCLGRSDVTRGQLSAEIDSLLSGNLTYDRLRSLSIVHTPLTDVPRSVCRLTTPTQLHLDNNQLVRLPDNCFPRLKHLRLLSASRNKIQKLQDGLFDGLQELVSLNFTENHIFEIGLHVFSNESDMISLRHIEIAYNNLTTLEPWPLVRGKLGTDKANLVTILLYDNRISAFTNAMRWKVDCSVKPGFLKLVLASNEIRHVMDVVHGWGFTSFSELFCLFRFRHGQSSVRVYLCPAQTFACDCIDYPLYVLEAAFPFYGLLENCYCIPEHSDFYYIQLPKIPLDQFVCESSKGCPPGCRCVYRPGNATLHVHCSNTNLSVLPLELPELPKSDTKYKLDFSNNRLLRRLEHRDYFINTSILDISNCAVDDIPLNVWKDISTMKEVLLGGNSLKSLPPNVATVPMTSSISLKLVRNPWACSCENRWMSKWLHLVQHSLVNVDGLLCGSPARLRGKNIMKISDEEFCHDPVSAERTRAVIISLSVAGAVVVLLSVAIIVYRLRVKLYTRWKFHPFDRDECPGEDMDYDVFLSCSSDDNLPHGNGIRQQLEQRGYRVCYPPRDFVAGVSIHENIYNAVVRSKRTVCLLTSNFLQRSARL